jgi:hypothetical protein
MSSKVRSGFAELLYGKEVQNCMASYMEYAVESRVGRQLCVVFRAGRHKNFRFHANNKALLL